ncbi:MAG TPA: DNA polymerase I [Candidatus Marinimicrobia bacterium]|nr:DNA polymerase I [Candidatus Neomarinimicrobiota bacterium]
MPQKRLFLVDGMAIAYRAHFAFIRNPLLTSDGRHVSAAYGFMKSILKLINDENPDYLAVVFDAKEKTFRHEKYPEYKATREKMPFEMRPQIPWINELLDSMNIPVLTIPGYEADDIIGTLASKVPHNEIDCYLVSGDKDFMQLVNEHIFLYSPAVGSKELIIYNADEVKKKWGVSPEQIIDLLALMGDSSDNVPGIPGIGEKSAVKLLQSYGSLENVIANAENEKNARIRKGLIENKESGYLSRELVTIKTDVPVKPDLDAFRFSGFNREALKKSLEKLEFYGLVNELQLGDSHQEVKQNYKIISNQEELKNFFKLLSDKRVFAFDTETDHMDANRAGLVGLSFCFKNGRAYYLPVKFLNKEKELFGDGDDLDKILKNLKPILENPSVLKIGHNIKYDMLVLKKYGIDTKGPFFDTMIAEYLLNPDMNSYKLDHLALRYLNYRMQPIEELIGDKKSRQITMDKVPLEKTGFYAAEDADITWMLYDILKEKIVKEKLKDVFEKIEVPLIPVLTRMENHGVYVDVNFLEVMQEEVDKEIRTITDKIYSLAGETFNINSPKQLGYILFDKLKYPVVKKTKTGYSTDVTVLETLKKDYPLAAKLLEYRMLSKLQSTYIETLPRQVNSRTGRIHTSFNQTVAATGRLSSTDPNFQNIPIRTESGRKIRKAFIAGEKGWKIMAADYSQIELRIMAHLSTDKNLMDAFLHERDVHAHTASLVFGVSVNDVTQEMRRTAKVVNFGIMYGAGAFRISNELDLSRQEASAIIKAYFDQYEGVRNYIETLKEEARKTGCVRTLLGRYRQVPDINSDNRNLREAAERMAVNMPVQGSAADLIKLAMIKIDMKMLEKNMKSKMILQVHDELVFEVSPDEIQTLSKIVKEEMESAMSLCVPLKVDIGIGDSWFEAH